MGFIRKDYKDYRLYLTVKTMASQGPPAFKSYTKGSLELYLGTPNWPIILVINC